MSTKNQIRDKAQKEKQVMKYEITTDKDHGTIVLVVNDEIVLISHMMSRVLDIVDDMHKNKGESQLLKPNKSALGNILDL